MKIARSLMAIDIDSVSKNAIDLIIKFGFDLLIAIVCTIIGLKLIKVFTKLLKKNFLGSKMDQSIATFLISIINISLKIMLFITMAGILGLEMTSFIAVLSTASLAIGLSLQGSLSNFAGGVLILLLKPFKVGDYIIEDNKKNEGTVVSIEIFYTKLMTGDNKIIVIPNGTLSNNSLTNVSKEPFRRLDINVDVAYNSDIANVKEILNEILIKNEFIAQDRNNVVAVSGLGAHSIQFVIQAWVNTEHYWDVKHVIYEQIKFEFDNQNIVIPYEQLDVHINK